jgi:hypothetical protein
MKYDDKLNDKMDAVWYVWKREHPGLTNEVLNLVCGLWMTGAIDLRFKHFEIK